MSNRQHSHDHQCGCTHESLVHGHDCQCHHHHDFDNLDHHHGIEVMFEGEYNTKSKRVWDTIVSSNTWIPGIIFEDPKAGGTLSKHISELEEDKFMILDYEDHNLLSFNWLDQSIVTVNLYPEDKDSTRVKLTVWLPEVTDNSLDDLVDWVINLKRLNAVISETDLQVNEKERFYNK